MSSSAPSLSVSKIPYLAAAGLFAAAAVFISRVTATKLDALELACLGACLAAAGACAAFPFALAHARRVADRSGNAATPDSASPAAAVPKPVQPFSSSALQPFAPSTILDSGTLAARVATAVDARLAAALPAFTAQLADALAALDNKRHAEVLLAVAETSAPRALDSDTVPPSAGKPRLGRGLEGLIRGNTPKPSGAVSASSANEADQAAA